MLLDPLFIVELAILGLCTGFLAGLLGIGVVATLAYMFVPTHVVKAGRCA